MEKKINIVIADDHVLFRKGFIKLVSEFPFAGKIGEAGNGLELLELLRQSDPLPDVVLLDLKMPVMDGFEASVKIMELYPDIKIIILSMEDDKNIILHTIENGVNGYLLKNSEPEDVEDAITNVLHKGYYFNGNISAMIFDAFRNKNFKHNKPGLVFSERELEILRLICEGFTANEIAEKLFLSPRTIEGHKKNMLEKTGTKNFAGLIVFAIKNNLVKV